MKDFLTTFLFGAVIGITIGAVSPYSVGNWQFWAALVTIAIASEIYVRTNTKKQEEVLGTIAPRDGFAYFAGIGRAELNNHGHHAAIYAGKDKLFVVGVTTDKEPVHLECDNLEQATEAYRKLLGNRLRG